ncbi:MAG: HAD family hydrolase [Candidatus Aenigmarchaeota archaeon]|nr:HAD family hydrolase [Candidatus Aenigmarchaeota archaeon]
MKRGPGLIIFDLDGTLIDARHNLKENINYALKMNGYAPVTGNRIFTLIGHPLIDIYKIILPKKDAYIAAKLVKDYRKRYKKTCHIGVKILSGVEKTLEAFKRNGFGIAMATAKGEAQTKLLLKRLGLRKYFDLVVGYRYGKSQLRPKPHPDMILHIMKHLKFNRNRTIMVGDTQLDIRAGRNARVRTIAVKTGVKLGISRLEELKKARPDAIIGSVSTLAGRLKKYGFDIY